MSFALYLPLARRDDLPFSWNFFHRICCVIVIFTFVVRSRTAASHTHKLDFLFFFLIIFLAYPVHLHKYGLSD
jgi:hypothetical protein